MKTVASIWGALRCILSLIPLAVREASGHAVRQPRGEELRSLPRVGKDPRPLAIT